MSFLFDSEHTCVGDIDQVSEGEEPHAVTGWADLLVDLVAPPDGGVVQGVEHSVVAPRQMGSVEGQVGADRVVKGSSKG